MKRAVKGSLTHLIILPNGMHSYWPFTDSLYGCGPLWLQEERLGQVWLLWTLMCIRRRCRLHLLLMLSFRFKKHSPINGWTALYHRSSIYPTCQSHTLNLTPEVQFPKLSAVIRLLIEGLKNISVLFFIRFQMQLNMVLGSHISG